MINQSLNALVFIKNVVFIVIVLSVRLRVYLQWVDKIFFTQEFFLMLIFVNVFVLPTLTGEIL